MSACSASYVWPAISFAAASLISCSFNALLNLRERRPSQASKNVDKMPVVHMYHGDNSSVSAHTMYEAKRFRLHSKIKLKSIRRRQEIDLWQVVLFMCDATSIQRWTMLKIITNTYISTSGTYQSSLSIHWRTNPSKATKKLILARLMERYMRHARVQFDCFCGCCCMVFWSYRLSFIASKNWVKIKNDIV